MTYRVSIRPTIERPAVASTRDQSPGRPSARSTDGPSTFAAVLGQISQQQNQLDTMIGKIQRGQTLSATQLLALQALVYRHSENVEVVSKVIDKTVSALKTTLNMQV
jgi:hypothetical protein